MIETCLLNFQVTCVWWYYLILLPIVKEGILVWSESITIVQISTVVQMTISILLLSFQIFRKGEVSLFSSVAMQALGKLFSSSLRFGSQLQVLTPFIWKCYIHIKFFITNLCEIFLQISSVVTSNNFPCIRSISSSRHLAGFPLLSEHVRKEESLAPSSTPLVISSRYPSACLEF